MESRQGEVLSSLQSFTAQHKDTQHAVSDLATLVEELTARVEKQERALKQERTFLTSTPCVDDRVRGEPALPDSHSVNRLIIPREILYNQSWIDCILLFNLSSFCNT